MRMIYSRRADEERKFYGPPAPDGFDAAVVNLRQMYSKRLMEELSQRLEPIRDEFSLRLYHWSLSILEQQTSDDASLFWKVPSRVIRNLHQLLLDDEDPLRFFLLCHGCRHRSVLARLGQPAPSEGD